LKTQWASETPGKMPEWSASLADARSMASAHASLSLDGERSGW